MLPLDNFNCKRLAAPQHLHCNHFLIESLTHSVLSLQFWPNCFQTKYTYQKHANPPFGIGQDTFILMVHSSCSYVQGKNGPLRSSIQSSVDQFTLSNVYKTSRQQPNQLGICSIHPWLMVIEIPS